MGEHPLAWNEHSLGGIGGARTKVAIRPKSKYDTEISIFEDVFTSGALYLQNTKS